MLHLSPGSIVRESGLGARAVRFPGRQRGLSEGAEPARGGEMDAGVCGWGGLFVPFRAGWGAPRTSLSPDKAAKPRRDSGSAGPPPGTPGSRSGRGGEARGARPLGASGRKEARTPAPVPMGETDRGRSWCLGRCRSVALPGPRGPGGAARTRGRGAGRPAGRGAQVAGRVLRRPGGRLQESGPFKRTSLFWLLRPPAPPP